MNIILLALADGIVAVDGRCVTLLQILLRYLFNAPLSGARNWPASQPYG